MLVAIGLTSHIGLQAFFNIAVVSNLIPNTGISLPFFSYGGTALNLTAGRNGNRTQHFPCAISCGGEKAKRRATEQKQMVQGGEL